MNWQVYILQCSDGSLYTGITNNLELRVITHNSGRGAKYTKNRLPVRVVYKEYTKDKSTSLKRELEIKKLSRQAKKELINSINLSAS